MNIKKIITISLVWIFTLSSISFSFADEETGGIKENKDISNNLEKIIDNLKENITDEDLDKILKECEKIKNEIRVKKVNDYILEFNKESEEIKNKFLEESKITINNLEITKKNCLDGKVSNEDFEQILNECKDIKKEINIYKLQNYIEEFKKEENKKIIEKLSEENKEIIEKISEKNKEIIKKLSEENKITIDKLETIKESCLKGEITNEDLDEILNKCKEIEEEINKKKENKDKELENNKKANELQSYIEEFKKEENKEIIEKLSEENKIIINNLGITKANYLVGKITEDDFDEVLNKCKGIKKQINIYKLQNYIDEFNREGNKEIIEKLSEENKITIDKLETIKESCLKGEITNEDLDEILNKCKEIEEEINNKKKQPNANKLQSYIGEFKKEENKERIEKFTKESKETIDNLGTIRIDCLSGNITTKDFDKILNKCEEIKKELNIKEKNKIDKLNKINEYIDIFKEENKWIIEQLSNEYNKETIKNLEIIKADYIDDKKTEDDFDHVLSICKRIEENINSYKKDNVWSKTNKLQNYIKEFKKEENKEIIEKLSEESRNIIKDLETTRENYLYARITEEDFDEALNKCKEIKKEIKLYKLQNYINEFSKKENQEIIEQLSEKSKTIIKNLEMIKTDYLAEAISDKFFDNEVLNKCKEIKKEIKLYKLQNYIEEFKKEENKEIIEKFSEENKVIIEKLSEKSRNIIKNLETTRENYLINKIIEEDFEKVLNECKEIKEEIDICKLQIYIEEFKKEENKEIMEKRSVKREDTINNLESIKKEYLVGVITGEILNNVLNKCKVINSKINNKKTKKKKLNYFISNVFNQKYYEDTIKKIPFKDKLEKLLITEEDDLKGEILEKIITKLSKIREDYLNNKITENEFEDILDKCSYIEGILILYCKNLTETIDPNSKVKLNVKAYFDYNEEDKNNIQFDRLLIFESLAEDSKERKQTIISINSIGDVTGKGTITWKEADKDSKKVIYNSPENKEDGIDVIKIKEENGKIISTIKDKEEIVAIMKGTVEDGFTSVDCNDDILEKYKRRIYIKK